MRMSQAPLPFPRGSIDVIYMEEVIEHVSKSQAEALLLECIRILKTGGWIRITTPSLNYFCKRLLSEPAQTDEINDIFYLHSHRHIYSEEELENLLEVVGFVSVRQSFYRDATSHYGYFDMHPERFAFAPAESSQYWEASKPL